MIEAYAFSVAVAAMGAILSCASFHDGNRRWGLIWLWVALLFGLPVAKWSYLFITMGCVR